MFVTIHKNGMERKNASPFHFFSLAWTYQKIHQKKVNSRGNQAKHL